MLPGLRDGLGRAYVVGGPVVSTDTFQGGIAISSLGQVRETAGAVANYTNGFGVDDSGRLCVNAGVAVSYLEGIPRNAAGQVIGTIDAVPDGTESILGGLLIGPFGAAFTTAVPP